MYEDYLENLGFKLILLSKYDFYEQVTMFSEAQCVIAVHGAGLTNLIYTNNCCVFEIFSLQHGVRPDYMQIARAANCTYNFYIDTRKRKNNHVHLPENILLDFLRKNSIN